MGYSEILCHLCGVSFNIARLRRADEPPEAAWRSADWGAPGSFVMCEGYGEYDACSKDTGCCVALRTERKEDRHHTQGPFVEVAWEFWEGYDEDADESYEYASESGDEPLEYDSEDGSSDTDMEDASPEPISEEDEDEGSPFCDDYLTLVRILVPGAPKTKKPEVFYPYPTEGDKEAPGDKFGEALWEREKSKYQPDPLAATPREVSLVGVEHIAGPDCKDDRGYSGYDITAEEMKGCCTYQCLAYKDPNWTPEPDDQDFELESECFLTGIGDAFPSRDMDYPQVYPARHGLEEPHADTYDYMDADRETAMPFHPTCFDIFTRLSKQHLGKIDVHSLISWRNITFQNNGFDDIPRHPDVKSANQQWWAHNRGAEYLAANPIYIPSLPAILKSAIEQDPNFSVQNGAFAILQGDQSSRNTGREDPFLQLPQELREHVVDYLDSPDIVRLRSASRAFQQLPISLFYTLLRREMPWLWEIYSDHKPLFWTALEVRLIKQEQEQRQEFAKDLAFRRKVIKEEMPDVLEESSLGEVYVGLDQKGEMKRLLEGAGREERGRMNWYALYRGIVGELKNGGLKGLRNRARIWNDVEGIVLQVKELRDEGKILN